MITAEQAISKVRQDTKSPIIEVKENHKMFLVIISNGEDSGKLSKFNRFAYYILKDSGEMGSYIPVMFSKEDIQNFRTIKVRRNE